MTDLNLFWLLLFFVHAGLDAAAQNTNPATALIAGSHADTLSQSNLKTHINASNLNGHVELTTLKILLTTFPSKLDDSNDTSEQRKSDENRRHFEDILENPPYSDYSSEYDSNEHLESASSLSYSDNSEDEEEAAAKGSTDGLKSNDVINGSETSGNFVAINGEQGSLTNKASLSGNYNFTNDAEEKGDAPIAADEGTSTTEMEDQESLFTETGEESDESLFELNDPTEENWFGNISYEEDESTYSPRETISELEDIRKLLTKMATEEPLDSSIYTTEISINEFVNGQKIERKLEDNEDSGSINAEKTTSNDNSDSSSISGESLELSTIAAVNSESDSIESTEATLIESESNKEHHSATFESEENFYITETFASQIVDQESVEKDISEDTSSYESIMSSIMPTRDEGADLNYEVNADEDIVIVFDDIYSSSESDKDGSEINFDSLSAESPSEDNISKIQEDRVERTRFVSVNANKNENVSEDISESITEVAVVQENEEFSTTAGSDDISTDQTEQNVATESNENDSDSSSYSTEDTSEEIACEITGNCIRENSTEIEINDNKESVEVSQHLTEANTPEMQPNAHLENISNEADDTIIGPITEYNKEFSAPATDKQIFSDRTEEYLIEGANEDNASENSSDYTEEEILQVNITTEDKDTPVVDILSTNIEFDNIASITTTDYPGQDNEEAVTTESDSLIGDILKSIVEEILQATNSSSTLYESNEKSTEDNSNVYDRLTTLTAINEFTTESMEPKKELTSTQESEVQATDYPSPSIMELFEEVLTAENIPTDSRDESSDVITKASDLYEPTTETEMLTSTPVSDVTESYHDSITAASTSLETVTENVNKTIYDFDTSDKLVAVVSEELPSESSESTNISAEDTYAAESDDSEKLAITVPEDYPSYSVESDEHVTEENTSNNEGISEMSPPEKNVPESTNISTEYTNAAESGEYNESPIIDDSEKLAVTVPEDYPSYSVESDEHVTEENTSNNEGTPEIYPSEENVPEKNTGDNKTTTRQGETESVTGNVAEKIDVSYLQTDLVETEEYTENFFVTIPEELASDSLDSTNMSSEEAESKEYNERIFRVYPSETETSLIEEDADADAVTETASQVNMKSTIILEQTTEVTTEKIMQRFKDFAEIIISSEELPSYTSDQSAMDAPDVVLAYNNTDSFLNYTEVETPGENATLSDVLNFIYQRFLASILESDLELAENSTSVAVQDEDGETTEAIIKMVTNIAISNKSDAAPEDIYEEESIYSEEGTIEEDSKTSDEDWEESDLVFENESEEDETEMNINQSEEVDNEGSHIEEHSLSEDQSNDIILDEEYVPYILGKALESDVNISIKIIAEDTTFYVPPYAYLLEDLDNLVLNITWSSPNKMLNNSLSLTLTQISKYYVINGVQLNIVRGNEMLVWRKNVVILPKKVDEVGKYDCVVEFEDGVVVSLSNIDFLSKSSARGNTKNGSDVHTSTTNTRGRRIFQIEIASGCMGIALVLAAIIYVVITKAKKRSLKDKGASQHVAA